MVLKMFQVELDNPSKSYFPRQSVSGRVIVINEKEAPIKELTVRFKGEAKVHWGETMNTNNRFKQGEQRVLVFEDQEEYFDCKINILGNANTQLPAGYHTFPFNFTLPTGIPSSYVGPVGGVSYFLLVKMDVQNRVFDRKIQFTVNGILDLNLEAGANKPGEEQRSKNLCCFCCKSGPIGFTLQIPRKGFVPGERFPFTIEMFNQSRRDIKEVRFLFVQNVNFLATRSTYRDPHIIWKANGPTLSRGETESWNSDFLLPALPPTKLAYGRIVDINYYVQLEMEIPGGVNLTAEIPIIIGTIPFRNTFTALTTPGAASGAPILEDYPDLPPPSYVECMAFERFGPPVDENITTMRGINNEGAELSDGPDPSTSQCKKYVPKYVTYGWKRTE